MTRAELLKRLSDVEHAPQLKGRDVKTITAMLGMDALRKHVEVCEAAAGRR
ncbi:MULTISPECIES: hypothetical protein [unclassified Aureimonas]|uniref:hypothetical protein n=1 Tax=unclassified Aureimonas TaxID=2615206 RepID=UPI000A7A1A94|nr:MULTISPECIES: hypothetical protein [unclassified Aureimonas]